MLKYRKNSKKKINLNEFNKSIFLGEKCEWLIQVIIKKNF